MNGEQDQLLRAWSARQALSPERQRVLEERIRFAIRQRRPATGSPHRALHLTLAGFAAGIAATLAVLFLVQSGLHHRDPLAVMLAEERGFFSERWTAAARVFKETERLFGANLHWIALSEQDLELGVADPPVGGMPMMVRITLVARSADRGDWHRIWQTEVVARTDDLLEINAPGDQQNRMAIWMHRLDGGLALVENRLTLQAPLRMESESSEVLRFGATRSVKQFTQGDTEYRLLQTVSAIGGKPCS